MFGKIVDAVKTVSNGVTNTIQLKRKAQIKSEEMRMDYLKSKMTTFVFSAISLAVLSPLLFYFLSPLLKYLPFMPEVLNDYKKIIDHVGFNNLWGILKVLLGAGGAGALGAVAGKVIMASKEKDTEVAKEKIKSEERVKRGVIGDDFVSLKAKPGSILRVKKFVKEHGPYAIMLEKDFGLPASAVLAHAALESFWGTKILKAWMPDPDGSGRDKINTNNVFNIKADYKDWTGPVAYRKVWEVREGENKDEKHGFRVYTSVEESYRDYGNLLLNEEKNRYIPVTEAESPEEYANALYQCGYMTDPEAPKKMKQIMDKYFDYET